MSLNKYSAFIQKLYTQLHYSQSKYSIAIDVDSRIILYSQVVKGSRHDTKFVISTIRSLKKIQCQIYK